MRKFFYYSLLCAVWIGANSCKSDEASSPPKPSFTVNKTTGLSGDTEFMFIISQVGANAVSLLPYGTEKPNLGGILVSTFTDGKDTIKFKYAEVGTFNAVVVANNHSADGKSIKNTYSDPVAITITSDLAAIASFDLLTKKGGDPVNTASDIDDVAGTIAVTVPFGTNPNGLIASYDASAFSTILVGSAAQVNGETANNFTNPVTYVVKANNGTTTKSYVVTVTVTPVETVTTIKTFTGTSKGKDLGSAVDNAAKTVVLFDIDGSNDHDSVTVKYALDGTFAYIVKGTAHLKQSALLDITSSVALTVHSQDSVATTADYTLSTSTVPNLTVGFNGLNPQLSATTGGDNRFTAGIDVIKGTDITALNTDVSFVSTDGVTFNLGNMKIDNGQGGGSVAFSSGDSVDYTKDATLYVQVTDGTLVYWASYKISVTVVK